MDARLVHWTTAFWVALHAADARWNGSGLRGADAREHQLTIKDDGAATDTIIVSRRHDDTYSVIARHPFTLDDAPPTVASEVLYLVGLPHHQDAIDLMCKDAFLRALRRAAEDSDDALAVRKKMEHWARMLLPYLEQDATLTVADALASYRRDHKS